MDMVIKFTCVLGKGLSVELLEAVVFLNVLCCSVGLFSCDLSMESITTVGIPGIWLFNDSSSGLSRFPSELFPKSLGLELRLIRSKFGRGGLILEDGEKIGLLFISVISGC